MDEHIVRRRLATGLLAFALAALAAFGAWVGDGWDGYSIGLAVVAGLLVVLGVASILALRKARA